MCLEASAIATMECDVKKLVPRALVILSATLLGAVTTTQMLRHRDHADRGRGKLPSHHDLLRARACCEDGISLAAIPLRQRHARCAEWCHHPHERPVAVERRPRSGGVRGPRVPGWRDERRLSSLRCHSGVLCQVWAPSEGVWVWEGCRVACVWGRVYASYGRRAGWPRNLPTYLPTTQYVPEPHFNG